MIARATVQDLLHRLADALPVAWRHDPIFRGTAIGAGVTSVLFLLRVAGPHAPELDPVLLRPAAPIWTMATIRAETSHRRCWALA